MEMIKMPAEETKQMNEGNAEITLKIKFIS